MGIPIPADVKRLIEESSAMMKTLPERLDGLENRLDRIVELLEQLIELNTAQVYPAIRKRG